MLIKAEKAHTPSMRVPASRAPEQIVFPFHASPHELFSSAESARGDKAGKEAQVSAWHGAVRATPEHPSGLVQAGGRQKSIRIPQADVRMCQWTEELPP